MPAGESEPGLTPLSPSATAVPVSAVIDEYAREARERAAPTDRPHVALNMVSSVDGRATIAARSGGLSGAADRALFHGLRAITDAVLVGAGTVRGERYGRMIRDPDVRDARERAGRAREPLACVVSSRLHLDASCRCSTSPRRRS